MIFLKVSKILKNYSNFFLEKSKIKKKISSAMGSKISISNANKHF
jgi:hypothetical protein